jgi:hypothetical protein
MLRNRPKIGNQTDGASGGRNTLSPGKALVFEAVNGGLPGLKKCFGGFLQCVAVVFFMGVPLGATHQSSSSFLVFSWPDGLHRLQHLPEKILQVAGQFVRRTEHELNQKSFEQTGANVAIGLVIVLPRLVYFFDFPGFRSEQNCLQIVMDKVGVNVGPTIIDGVSREISQFQERLDGKKTGFDSPALAINLPKVGTLESFGIGQGSEQHLHFALGQFHPHQPIGDCSLGIDVDTQFLEHSAGFLGESFPNNTRFAITFHEMLNRFAETHRQANDAMRAVVLMQKGDAVRGIGPVIHHANICRKLGDGALCNHDFGHIPRMKLHGGNNFIEQIVMRQQSGRRHPVVLVAVPTKLFAKPLLIRQTKAGAVGSPQPHTFPAFGLEISIKQRNPEHKKIPEKSRQQFLTRLHQGALGRGKFSTPQPVEKAIQFYAQCTFEQRNRQPGNALKMQHPRPGKIFARPAKVLLGTMFCHLRKLPQGAKICTKGGIHDYRKFSKFPPFRAFLMQWRA